jgi:hypothetical protein
MQQIKQQRSSKAIEFQISALERQMSKSGVNKFPLEGKIKKLKIELADAKQFEFLSR